MIYFPYSPQLISDKNPIFIVNCDITWMSYVVSLMWSFSS